MAAPVNSVPPAITGVEEVGNLLTVDNGTWTGGVNSYSYQWQRALNGSGLWENITGENQSTYLVLSDNVANKLRCAVTATNNSGSTVAFSNETAEIPPDFFVPEDGTGLANANSLVTIEYAQQYHAYRNNLAWGLLLVGERKAALIKATDYLGSIYRLRWKGTRVNGVQALDWPRAFVERDDYEYQGLNGSTFIGGFFYFPSDEVPKEVKDACCELSLKASTAALAPDVERITTVEKVGPLEVQYDKYGKPYTQYRQVENLLAPFLKTGASGTFRDVMVG